MLVLTRKSGEAIRIGDLVTVTVLVTGRNRVKLGILGPPQISVVREEVVPAVQAQAPARRDAAPRTTAAREPLAPSREFP